MKTTDYYSMICSASSRFEAATLIRASALQFAATGGRAYSNEQRVAIVEQAEQQAQDLERDYIRDEDYEPYPESQHPWRSWLTKWGWPQRAA